MLYNNGVPFAGYFREYTVVPVHKDDRITGHSYHNFVTFFSIFANCINFGTCVFLLEFYYFNSISLNICVPGAQKQS